MKYAAAIQQPYGNQHTAHESASAYYRRARVFALPSETFRKYEQPCGRLCPTSVCEYVECVVQARRRANAKALYEVRVGYDI